MIAFAHEEPAQPLLADVGFDGDRKTPLARRHERPGIEIGTEHLHGRPDRMARRFLEQKNGE